MNAMGGGFAGQQPPMPEDQNMMGGAPDPNMGADPGMDAGMPEDPSMMGGDPNMDMGDANPNKAKEDIQKNIGKGCADFRNYQGQDKEDLGKWIEGMLNSVSDEDSEAGIGDESEVPMDAPMPQMETVIFTKGQLDRINEEFGIDNMSKKDDNKKEEKTKVNNNNSPFNNPNLNKK